MNLRGYQERAVERVVIGLERHKDALLVAPTGAGKTVMMAAIAQALAKARAGEGPLRVLVLQHRDELVRQNLAKFQKWNRNWPVARFGAEEKRWARATGFEGAATFAMVPTLVRNTRRMQPVDLVLLDECHHVMAPSWLKVLDVARTLNPDVKIAGVTATPNRADKLGLGKVFSHVADIITMSELIEGGHLVPPVARVVEAQLADQIRGVRRSAGGDYNMEDVARLIDHEPVTQAVISQWRTYAGDRQTVVFCATVDHAKHVRDAFERSGVKAGIVYGEQASEERQRVLVDFDAARLQVVVNVYALTEGFDSQPIGCVVLLRPSCFESTVLQMIGRGLRVVDPEIYPGVIKTDCEVLDFGASLNNLGGLDQVLRLNGRAQNDNMPGPAAMKPCHSCKKAIPLRARECPLCGFVYPRGEAMQLPIVHPDSLKLVQVDLLLKRSPFEWYEVHPRLKIATSFDVWALTFADKKGTWHAFSGRPGEKKPVHLASGLLAVALSRGDDWMREHGDPARAGRGASWLKLAPTSEQLDKLRRVKAPIQGHNRYTAQCWLTAKFAKREIARQFEMIRLVLDEREREAAAVRGVTGVVDAQVG